MASAKIGATDNLMILEICSSPYFAGIEFVTITWSSLEFSMLDKAFPKNYLKNYLKRDRE